jgi:hypothetical protein
MEVTPRHHTDETWADFWEVGAPADAPPSSLSLTESAPGRHIEDSGE